MAQTPRQMANNQQRTMATMKRKLLEMSAVWGDLDTYNMGELEDLAKRCDEVSKNLVDNAKG